MDRSPSHSSADSISPQLASATTLCCQHLEFSRGQTKCRHPNVRLGNNDDAQALCATCSYYERDAVFGVLDGCDHGDSLVPWRWAVGMTTAPRRIPTLERSLASVANAGWSQVRLFAEPNTDLKNRSEHAITQRDYVLGAFPNFYLGLSELFLRDPHAQAYLMFQDDVEIAAGARKYLERVLWPQPTEQCGIVSLYCPSHHLSNGHAGFQIESAGWDTWGALAYVFSPTSVIAFLTDAHVICHRRRGPADGLKNVDSVAGKWCSRTGWNYYVHTPSLVQHTGRTSTLYPTAGLGGRRRAAVALSQIPLE